MKIRRNAVVARLFVVGLLVVMAMAIASVASAQDDMAMVRVVHASPDAPAVDVLVDGDAVIEGLEFTQASDYLELPGGDYQVQVVPAGGAAADAVIDANLTLEGGQAYTVAAVNTLDSIEAQVYEDDLSAPADGKAHVRIVHASPDAPAVDVAVADGGPVLFENLEFPNASDYVPVDAGTYDLEVRPTGTEDVALAVPGFAAEAGMIYDVFAVGLLEDGSLAVAPFATEPMETAPAATPTQAAGATATTGAEATATPVGTGGGTPDAPATGAGGTSDSNTTNWAIFGVLGAALLVATGSIAMVTRRSRG